MAYYRMARRRLLEAVGPLALAPVFPLPAAPDPVEHCDVCRWRLACAQQRRDTDHLSLVAGIRSSQRRALTDREINTLTRLGELQLPVSPPIAGIGREALTRVQAQAEIQLEGRRRGEYLKRLIEPIEANRGLAALPAPSPADLFLDLEGDPYALEAGLDYLFGILETDVLDADGQPTYHAFWSTDADGNFSAAGEKRAFEATMDLIVARLRTDPNLHVYHFGTYEATALKRLMGRYATREDEVDALLRGGILVDLHRVTRQGLRASVESYSIKKLEPLYGFHREVELRDATSSIVEFENWLQLAEGERPAATNLENIEAYNRDDVVSTWQLREWLERVCYDAIARRIEIPRPTAQSPEPPPELNAKLQQVREVEERLTTSLPVDRTERSPAEQAQWLLAQLLSWHRREDKSTWWRYYTLLGMSDEERVDEKEPIGLLEFTGYSYPDKRSTVYRYRYPPQEHGISTGTRDAIDPATGARAGTVFAVDEDRCTIDLKRGNRSEIPHPRSLVPKDYVPTDQQRARLLELGEWVAENGIAPDGDRLAARRLLLREAPRLRQGTLEADPGEDAQATAIRVALELDRSVLPIQGPPGSGKTHIGAHMVVELLRAGKRVGVTANSHKVIGHLLDKICEVCPAGVRLAGIQKCDAEDVGGDDRVRCTAKAEDVADALAGGECNLAAGTAWLWADARLLDSVDVLFIDEAGQFALANALAVAGAAASLVLLGEPQQLDQPLKGSHPDGAEVSCLGHILGENATIGQEQGLFLPSTYRLHPALAHFTSEAFYDGRLAAVPNAARHALSTPGPLGGAGPRLLTVEHRGNDTSSAEEAETIAEAARQLVESGTTWTDSKGDVRPLGWGDILIVAPYNDQVAAIRELLPGAHVGTVDKFQGQEAPVSIYSMASSSPEDAPRGMSFLYSRNRLNVATSRAECVAILVCAPRLLTVRARTPVEMRLANALCQFVEAAERAPASEGD
jgi:uncharacterized protein